MKTFEISPNDFNHHKLKAVLIDNDEKMVLEVVTSNTIKGLEKIMRSCGHTWDVVDDRRETFNKMN